MGQRYNVKILGIHIGPDDCIAEAIRDRNMADPGWSVGNASLKSEEGLKSLLSLLKNPGA